MRKDSGRDADMDRKRCEIICVGTELLLGDILNTNAQYLAQGLSELGLDLYIQTVVGDNEARLEQAVRAAMERAEILLFTGGLGPTPDDLTKEVVSRCFGRDLLMNQEALQEIHSFYALTHRVTPLSNRKQALIPEGGIILKNPQGTAPGCILFSDAGHTAVLMPGPPREMRPMFQNQVVPYLRQFSSGTLLSRIVRVISLGESRMAEMLDDLMQNGVNPTLAPYAKDGEAMVRVTAGASSREAALALTEPVIDEIKRRLGRHAYGVDVDNLETVLAGLLADSGLKVSFLEAGSGALAACRIQAAEGAFRVCGMSLSAPEMSGLAALLGFPQPLPENLSDACALLAKESGGSLESQVRAVICLNENRFACAVTVEEETRQYIQVLPARSQDYARNAAVQACFDMTRLMLLDRMDMEQLVSE